MSSTPAPRPAATPGDVAAKLLHAYPVAAHALPPHDVRWARSERVLETHEVEPAPAGVRPVLRRFCAEDIVQVDERVPIQNRRESRRRDIYRTRAGIYAWVAERVPEPRTFPCGHQGWVNLGGGRYGCGADGCEEAYGREIARAVLDGRRA